MMPTVSIIVPVYNVEGYIKRCVDSILNQTFKDFELLLIDDGSPDKCGEICDNYAKIDKRVKVIHKSNGGVSSARNLGLENASGKYIMFCDSDDCVEANWIERLKGTLDLYPNNWIVSGIHKIQNINEVYLALNKKSNKDDYFLIYKEGLSAYCWNKIYQKDIIKQHDIWFDKKISNGEDILFNIEYLKYMEGIVAIPDILYHYNQDNDSSVSVRYNAKRFEDSRFAYSVRKEVISPKYEKEYSEIWYFRFWEDIHNVFDSRNKSSFFEKISYCSSILKSLEFQECYSKIDRSSINKIYLKLIENGNYFWIFLYEKIRQLFK